MPFHLSLISRSLNQLLCRAFALGKKTMHFFLFACLISPALMLSAAPKNNVLFLADPFVLEENGVFYIYGTSANNGIIVYKSTDLSSWEGPCGATEGLALHKNDSWGSKGFWAPEVYKIGKRFLMTYSADEQIAYAWSDAPTGPFVNESKTPYLEEKGIDSHIFIDNSVPYLFWVRFDGGNVIFEAEMSKDLKTVKMDTVKRIIDVQEGTWEKTKSDPVANVAEGPFVIKHNGFYYLTYSCNHYRSPDYAVGYATAPSLKGPWTRYSENPILLHHGGYQGTGHHALLKTSKGKYYIIYHAHYSDDRIAPRRTLISPISFKKNKSGGPDILVVSETIIEPTLKSN